MTETPAGTRIRLRVKPGARRDGIVGPHGGALKVTVAASPERGKANRAVLDLLAGALGLAPSSLEIVAGETSPDKIVLIPLPPGEVAARLRGPE
jgi:uncharacterized protein (TIGR00251 family)